MSEVFESRWGFHPCSRETDRKLRKLNAAYQKALSSAAAWGRWERKEPHNRILRQKIYDEQNRVCGRQPVLDALGQPLKQPEPKFCPVFCRKVLRKVHYDRSGQWVPKGVEREFVEVDDLGIPAAARQARTPISSKEMVKPLCLTVEEIDSLLAKLS